MNGLSDLLETYLIAREYRNAADELAEWSSLRYHGFAKAFALDPAPSVFPEDVWSSGRRDPCLRLFHQTLNAYEKLSSPFDGHLEMSGVLADLYRGHHRPIREGLEVTRTAMRALLLDLLVRAWGLTPEVTVTDDELRSCGFDPEAPAPDPDAYY